MSGSSGGGPYGGGPSGPVVDCKIIEKTILNSPNKAVLGQLKVGDDLDVLLQANNVLVAQPKSGPPAGSLTPARLADLIDCMTRGFKYRAIVQKISGGRCDVEIRPK
jgi:hypothetical protein